MSAGINAGASTPNRKPWAELTEEEKVETLRAEMRMNQYRIRRIERVENELNSLKSHTHDGFGQVTIPMHLANGNNAGASLGRIFDPLA